MEQRALDPQIVENIRNRYSKADGIIDGILKTRRYVFNAGYDKENVEF